MAKINLPGQNVPISLPDGQINPVWYSALKGIEQATTPPGNVGAGTLRGNPTGAPAAEGDIPLGANLQFAAGALAVFGLSAITRTVNFQTGTTYTFALTDAGNICDFANASPVTVTVPLNATIAFPVGTQIDVMQGGAGKVTFSPAGGVTILSTGSNKSLGGQYAAASFVKVGTDTWRLFGNLIP
jgi:hypothetical protein